MNYPTLRHPYCNIVSCNECFSDHQLLWDFLEEQLPEHNTDYLMNYRNWIDKKLGHTTETRWGWATPEVFEKKNIDAFVKHIKES